MSDFPAHPRPRSSTWQRVCPWRAGPTEPVVGAVYQRQALRVISTRVDARYPDGSGEIGPQDHVSVSRRGHRPSDADIALALAAFGMLGTEEDNHHPGNARHFWRPVDPARRVACECKATEETITEPDGYTWTNPTPDEGPCRGCEFAVSPMGTGVCPLHGSVVAVYP